ncbi:hypothetical protein LTR97_003698 [Elasticomyces elasticus]|uniref:Amidohydrolase-related domain-containing protein n=1 Tax=Elasticomyces elasticus TaxID=574655 RepID=A0AAN7ZPB5_9PEZI|nr:hypothetical protein LTR97_003698 [Elasticomyces elasticus]
MVQLGRPFTPAMSLLQNMLVLFTLSRQLHTSQAARLPDRQLPPRPTKHQRTLAERLPEDTWDSHMHVIDPARFPLSPDAAYVPQRHDLFDAVSFESSVSMKNIVMVQPSIYATDNSALLDGLKGLGPDRSRGVVQFDLPINSSKLQAWDALGVRGVRLNVQSTGAAVNVAEFAALMRQYAVAIKPFGWVLQAYIPMYLLDPLAPTIRELGVDFVVDHFGQPAQPINTTMSTIDPYAIQGFGSLISLLEGGNTWVKFSAPYRVNLTTDWLDAVAKEVLNVRSDRVVFATDWPHTRFEGLDIRPFIERCLDWAEEANCVEKVFSTNAKSLWRVEEE